MVIAADGTKVPVGLRLGDTESKVVVTDLLADLVVRGLRFERGILAVLDGSKALRAAVAKVFDAKALVQRCTLGYDHGHVPAPIEVADHFGDSDLRKLLREVLMLTKVNWDSAGFADADPDHPSLLPAGR